VEEVLEDLAMKAKLEARAEMRKKLPKIGCAACDESGLVISLDTSGDRVAKECECKLAWRRAKRTLEAQAQA
jgi:hypothetical protein